MCVSCMAASFRCTLLLYFARLLVTFMNRCCAGNAAADGRSNGFTTGLTNGYTDGAAIGCRNGDGGASTAAVQWDGQRLYWFDEAPPALQYNKFVRSGYRAGMSYRQCACSIFSYHNEIGALACYMTRAGLRFPVLHRGVNMADHHCQRLAGNIWTHLLPLLVLSAALLLGWLPAWPGALQNFLGQLGGILVCLCGSVTYHTLMARHQNYRTWLAVDVSHRPSLHPVGSCCWVCMTLHGAYIR